MVEAKAFAYLNTLPDAQLTIVDVGCHMGHFQDGAIGSLAKPAFWVGIDPLDMGIGYKYNVFIKKAITNIEAETILPFYDYNYSPCSSLMKMTDNVTHNPAEYDEKWFAPFVFEGLRDVIGVHACSLKDALADIPETKTIHYLKIDAQGMDIHVVESLGEHIKDVYFVQLECVISKNKSVTLYENQTHYTDDVAKMEELGFGVYNQIDYTSSPEADVVFYNKALVKNE